MAKTDFQSIDEYISTFPKSGQDVLQKVRSTIKKAAPEAKEKISYQIPTFTFHGNLVHFAAFKNHIGFYPTPSAILAFKKDLAKFKQAKGSVRFPIDKPMPLPLISKIVRFRVKENETRKGD